MANRGHLPRLDRVWIDQPIFFITSCASNRRRELDNQRFHEICSETWRQAENLYGWRVGRYVLMPDHVHFFCAPGANARRIEIFVGKWKEWTAKQAHRLLNIGMPLWQEGFFDHVLRSEETYEEKWRYVHKNPVRARLVSAVEDWPYQGELRDLL